MGYLAALNLYMDSIPDSASKLNPNLKPRLVSDWIIKSNNLEKLISFLERQSLKMN